MKKAFDTKVYFRDGWLKNYTFVYVKTKIHASAWQTRTKLYNNSEALTRKKGQGFAKCSV